MYPFNKCGHLQNSQYRSVLYHLQQGCSELVPRLAGGQQTVTDPRGDKVHHGTAFFIPKHLLQISVGQTKLCVGCDDLGSGTSSLSHYGCGMSSSPSLAWCWSAPFHGSVLRTV